MKRHKIGVIAQDLIQAVTSIENCKEPKGKPTAILSGQVSKNVNAVSITTMNKMATPKMSSVNTKKAIGKLKGRYLYLYESQTLMGNIASDINAVVHELQPEKLVVCTAWIERNIYIKESISYRNGVAAHKHPMATDAITPVKESNIAKIIKNATGLNPKCIDISDIKRGSEYIARLIKNCHETIIICDAMKPAHLDSIAEAVLRHKDTWIACGSGGLIRAMSPYLGYEDKGQAINPTSNNKPVLLVLGTINNVTAIQLVTAAQQGMVYPVLVEPGDLWHRDKREYKILHIAQEVSEQLHLGNNVAITTTYSRFFPQFRRIAAYILSSIARISINDCNIETIFVSGGNTSYALCKTLDVQKLEVEGSTTGRFFPLLTSAYANDGTAYRLCFKSGSVWDEMTIVKALQFLRQG